MHNEENVTQKWEFGIEISHYSLSYSIAIFGAENDDHVDERKSNYSQH